MARPRKQEHEQRTASTRADLTVAEKEHVRAQAAAAGLSEAEYVRRRVLGHVVSPSRARADASLVTELSRIGMHLGSRIGNNLNQIARAANSGAVPLAVSTDPVLAELSATMADLREVLAKVASDHDS